MQEADCVLLEKLKLGDELALERIFNLFHHRLYCFARKYIKEDHEAREAVLTVFYNLWCKRSELILYRSLEAYLFACTRNQCIDYLRKRKGNLVILSEAELQLIEYELEHPCEELTDLLIADETQKKIYKLISLLPPQQMKIFKMSRLDGLTVKEISALLGLTQRTIESHIYKALVFIKGRIGTPE